MNETTRTMHGTRHEGLFRPFRLPKKIIAPILVLLLVPFALASSVRAGDAWSPSSQAATLHPTFALLDHKGENVLASGAPLSTMRTCGQCHDTEFIVEHSRHSDLGLSEFASTSDWRSAGVGPFGGWDPLTYRFLSRSGDELLDLSTADWLMLYGERVVGGGPGEVSRGGSSLGDIRANRNDPEGSILDDRTGKPDAWNWTNSGTLEINCFLCHLENPDSQARLAAIRSAKFDLAATATLFQTRIVRPDGSGLAWNADAFGADGELAEDALLLQDPTSTNCGACHGAVHTDLDVPLVLSGCTWETVTAGQVIAAQRVSDSGINVAEKDSITRAWDVHAERELTCTDCHFAPNNPAHATAVQTEDPDHLSYDPRTLEIGEYLERPDHDIATGSCNSCHIARAGHADWLPYVDRHMASVACETCHIPRLFAPAVQTYDWTVLRPGSQPASACRGITGTSGQTVTAGLAAIPPTVTNLVVGYEPALLGRAAGASGPGIAPYNLFTSFYWVYTDAAGNERPVRLFDLQRAYFDGGQYSQSISNAFDTDFDGQITEVELSVSSPSKFQAVASRLEALGLREVRIEGLVRPYTISHSIARGEWALSDCQSCHGQDSRLQQPLKLADRAPLGILPQFAPGSEARGTGRIYQDSAGAVYYQPVPSKDGIYILGASRLKWVDAFGGLVFLATLLIVAGHGAARGITRFRRRGTRPTTSRTYLYEPYERFWHWLQTLAIVILLVTGLIIHRPDILGFLSFRGAVSVHNAVAAILAANAGLSLFYHLSTGRVRQFIPRPYGFFEDAIAQTRFYVRGVFAGHSHPFQKTPDRKLNPLQQVTYFGLLTVLLPLQGVTGILIWGSQRWTALAGTLGGLPFLAPAHTLIAWLFAAFILAHVYLTTMGTSPLESIRGMVTGFEEVEVHQG